MHTLSLFNTQQLKLIVPRTLQGSIQLSGELREGFEVSVTLNDISIGRPVIVAGVAGLLEPAVNGTYNGFYAGRLKGI